MFDEQRLLYIVYDGSTRHSDFLQSVDGLRLKQMIVDFAKQFTRALTQSSQNMLEGILGKLAHVREMSTSNNQLLLGNGDALSSGSSETHVCKQLHEVLQ